MGRGELESRNLKMKVTFHRLFELGVLLKGVDGGFELGGGLLLLFAPPAAIRGVVLFLVQGELQEDPTDLVANLLLHSTRSVIHSRVAVSVFLLVHGIAKLLLVAGLVTNKLWSYPVAIVVFGAFTVYQIYELSHQYSFFLAAITVLDVIVVMLIIDEYRRLRTARKEPDGL